MPCRTRRRTRNGENQQPNGPGPTLGPSLRQEDVTAAMDGEGSATRITAEHDVGNREWEARCEGRAFRYPLDRCASESTAARKALRERYHAEGLRVKVDRLESHKHHGRDLWDFKARFHVR